MHTNSTRFLEGAAFLGACEAAAGSICEGPAAAASRPLCRSVCRRPVPFQRPLQPLFDGDRGA